MEQINSIDIKNIENNDSSLLSEKEKKAIISAILESGKIIVIKDPDKENQFLVYSRSPIDLDKVSKDKIVYLD